MAHNNPTLLFFCPKTLVINAFEHVHLLTGFFLWVANGHPRCELKDLVLLPIDFLLARSPACMVSVCMGVC